VRWMYSGERQATSVAGVLRVLVLVARWGSVPIASTIGFYMAAAVGALVASRVEYWCPWGDAELVAAMHRGESVMCPVPLWVNATLYSFFAAAAAIAVVALGSRVAPARRPWVPWVIYAAGAVVVAAIVRDNRESDGPRRILIAFARLDDQSSSGGRCRAHRRRNDGASACAALPTTDLTDAVATFIHRRSASSPKFPRRGIAGAGAVGLNR
jgi:hypothetical protein